MDRVRGMDPRQKQAMQSPHNRSSPALNSKYRERPGRGGKVKEWEFRWLGNVRVMLGLQQSLKMRRNGSSDRDISIKKKFQNTTNNFWKVVKI